MTQNEFDRDVQRDIDRLIEAAGRREATKRIVEATRRQAAALRREAGLILGTLGHLI